MKFPFIFSIRERMPKAYKLFGSHFVEKDGVRGVVFRVWAPKGG